MRWLWVLLAVALCAGAAWADINIGVTLAQPVNNDGSPNNQLDIGHLPVYTLSNGTAEVQVPQPHPAGRAGRGADLLGEKSADRRDAGPEHRRGDLESRSRPGGHV